MMIDSQAPLVFWGEAVHTAVYLNQQTPNAGLTKRDVRNGYQSPYLTPYEMMQTSGRPSDDNDGNEILYKAPLLHLRRFCCYASRLLPKPQSHGKFSPRSMRCMMVGYVGDLTTLWRILDLAFRVVKSQSVVIFDEERNTHASCPLSDQTDIFELREQPKYVKEIETGRDGVLNDHAGTSRTGEGHGSGDHDCTDEDTHHILPNADNRQSPTVSTGVRSRPPDEEDASLVSRETFVHIRHLRRENAKARRMVAMTKQSCQPPRMNHVTSSQVKSSANTLIIMAKALASRSISRDPLTSTVAMDSPQRDNANRAMEDECALILLNNTFTTINSREARQLRFKLFRSKWVYKTKNNPEGTIQYKARLLINGYEQTDFGETYALVGKLTTFRFLISMVGKHGWNIDHLDVVPAFLNPEVDDNDIYMTLPEGWPEGLNTPVIIVRLKKALCGLKQAP